MKISNVLLTVSLVGNLGLVALIVAPSSPSDEVAAESAATVGAAPAATTTASEPGEINTADVNPKLWEGLSAGDYAALADRLRAQGFPYSIVRAIVASQVNESFAARRKALTPSKTATPFWQAEKPVDPKTLAALRELSREQAKLMKDLVGPNPLQNEDPMYAAYLKRQFGDLPTEKVEQLRKVQQDYSDLRNEIYSGAGLGSGGPVTLSPEERTKIALLEKEQRADMQQLLSPEEFEDYELRSSTTANSMRYQLSAFGPTEEEFRTIFPLQRAFDEKYRTLASENPSQEILHQRSEAQKELTARIVAALGTERGAEFERASDNNYRQIYNVVSRLELPKETATEVWNVQKDVQKRLQALRADSNRPQAERNAQLAALAQEATTKLTGALGQRGLDVYKQYGGYWLQNFQPQPAGNRTIVTPGEPTMIFRP